MADNLATQIPQNAQGLDPQAAAWLNEYQTTTDPARKAHALEMFKQTAGYRAQSPLVDAAGLLTLLSGSAPGQVLNALDAGQRVMKSGPAMFQTAETGGPLDTLKAGAQFASDALAGPYLGAMAKATRMGPMMAEAIPGIAGKIKNYNADARAISLEEADKLIQAAAKLMEGRGGPAAARAAAQTKDIQRSVIQKFINAPDAKASLNEIKNLAPDNSWKGAIKRVIGNMLPQDATVTDAGRAYPLWDDAANKLRGWIQGTR